MEILKISEKQLSGEFQFHSLKVDLRTQNKADVLKCFAQLDFYVTSATSIIESDEFLFVQDNGRVFSCENAINSDGYTWVDLQQLKEMVILSRNDVNDANHTDQDGWKWFLTSNSDGYVFAAGNAQQLPRWDKSPLDHVDLKPIVKDENLQEKDNFQTIKVNGLEDLIDGRKALSALLAWEKVQINFQPWDEHLWVNIDPTKDAFSITDFFNDCSPSGRKVFFRLKPSVMTINGIECSRPELNTEDDLELLEKDQQYWLVDLTSPDLASQYKWHGSSEEYSWAERGLIHLKKQNAISHAKALIQATVGSKAQ
nr:hypothetical protein [uncultured Acinetobacter sp.]